MNVLLRLWFSKLPWNTTVLSYHYIKKSFLNKNKVLKHYIKKKEISQKNGLHNNYKIYRNLISALMKRSKQTCCAKYFESNLNNIKSTWKDIKSTIYMRSPSSTTPTLVTFQNKTIDSPKIIRNIPNNCFSTIGKICQAKKIL